MHPIPKREQSTTTPDTKVMPNSSRASRNVLPAACILQAALGRPPPEPRSQSAVVGAGLREAVRCRLLAAVDCRWMLLDLLPAVLCNERQCAAATLSMRPVLRASPSQRMHQSHPPTRKAGVQPVSHRGRGLAAKSRRAGLLEKRSGMSGGGIAATRDHHAGEPGSPGTFPLSRLHWILAGVPLGSLGISLASAGLLLGWAAPHVCATNQDASGWMAGWLGWIRRHRPGSSDRLSITPLFKRLHCPSAAGPQKRFEKCR